jgi:hypothetical protein
MLLLMRCVIKHRHARLGNNDYDVEKVLIHGRLSLSEIVGVGVGPLSELKKDRRGSFFPPGGLRLKWEACDAASFAIFTVNGNEELV